MRPTFSDVEDGVSSITLNSWEDFHNVIAEELLDYRDYIFRGQSSVRWKLDTTIDRAGNSSKGRALTEQEVSDHLRRFKYAVRGRLPRGFSEDLPDDFWWALGQHFGLATPLLDWTESPYVAAYFAFADVIKREEGEDESRVVWGLSREAVEEKNGELGPSDDRLEIFSPLRGENARLVNQRGLFSRVPIGHTVEEWVRKHFKGEMSSVILFSIVIPNGDSHRGSVLRVLNRMNANALSLFPDLDGASVYCNMDLAIEHY